MKDSTLLTVTGDPQLDVDPICHKGLFTPVAGLAEYQRPYLSTALERVAKYRNRDENGRVVLAGGSAFDGMTPWEAHTAERAAWGFTTEPEPVFTAAPPPATPVVAAPASGETPLTTVASLKRRLEAGVELTCTAQAHEYLSGEVGKTRAVARVQGNLARLAPSADTGLPKGHSFYFPSKAELRVTGPDTFDVLGETTAAPALVRRRCETQSR